LFNDVRDSRKWLEYFVDESWVEHLRHHRRVTRADADVEAAARRFLADGVPLAVRHFLAPPGQPADPEEPASTVTKTCRNVP
jgi:hypothetical protein